MLGGRGWTCWDSNISRLLAGAVEKMLSYYYKHQYGSRLVGIYVSIIIIIPSLKSTVSVDRTAQRDSHNRTLMQYHTFDRPLSIKCDRKFLLVVKYTTCYTSEDGNFKSARQVRTSLLNYYITASKFLTYQEYRRPGRHGAQGIRLEQDLRV